MLLNIYEKIRSIYKVFSDNGSQYDVLENVFGKLSESDLSDIIDFVQRYAKLEIKEVLTKICEDLDVYIEWHKENIEKTGFKPEEEKIKVRCYEIAKKQIKFRMSRL